MGEAIRTKDWTTTPLGTPENWPQSLRTTLSILLHSSLPTVLLWGPDSRTFYNDAYIPVLRERGQHPEALGLPAGKVWPRGLSGSYSHVHDESGEPAGVLITCTAPPGRAASVHKTSENELSFRSIVKQTPAGIVIFDGPEFVVTVANDTYLSVVDKTEDQLVGKPFFDVLPEIRDLIHPLLTSVLESGTPYYGYEFPVTLIRHGRREPTWFNFVYQPLRNDAGKVRGIIVVAHEVTELAKTRQALAASEKTFRNMVKHSPIAMAIFKGEDFIIEYANAIMLRKLWRKKEADVLARRLVDVFPEPIDQKYPDLLREVYTSGKIHKESDALAFVRSDDGMQSFYLDYEYAPLLGADGKAWGIMVTVSDTTDKVMARNVLEEKVRERTLDLQRSNQQLEQSNQDLQQFAHVASHDLKEPVRKIRIYSDRLESDYKEQLGPEGQMFLAKILKSTGRIFEMINGILSYSSLPGVEQPAKPVDLDQLINDIEIDLELLVEEHQAAIIRRNLPTIMGMPDLIYQLFYNLVNNALKFARKDTPVQITITGDQKIEEGNKYTRIVVADNGIGFEKDQAEEIFSTFKRLNSKDQYEGTGLGLALCRKIVERHGGRITARGEKRKGAEFTILLPMPS